MFLEKRAVSLVSAIVVSTVNALLKNSEGFWFVSIQRIQSTSLL